MKTARIRSSFNQIKSNETTKQVQREVAAINRVRKQATVSKKAALAFLQGAGIVTAKGNLKKSYR